LLWPEEVESGKLIYPFRIPVTFSGAPKVKSGSFTWEALRALSFRGTNRQRLDSPQQWGIKFSGNVIDNRREVDALVDFILVHT
jgi:hypothetical protein